MADLYSPVTRVTRLLVRAFFRRIEVAGLDNLPSSGGGILVSWHPNGMVDPSLIFALSPRRVVFGARHGLFRWPGLGQVMKSVGTVPIYRGADTAHLPVEQRREANQKSLDALAQAVAAGQFSCLFPEGDSHDSPHLMELKTGAARFFYRALQLQPPDASPPVIVPVGLHYDAKRRFRSNVLIVFHPPMSLPADLATAPAEGESPEGLRDRSRALTAEIERTLREVVHATESWELHHLMHRARKLVRAERAERAGARLGRPDMRERQLGFARIWAGYYRRKETHPDEVEALVARVREYDADMRVLGLEDHELDRSPGKASPVRAAALVAQVLGVYVLLPPLLVLGGIVNVGPFLVLRHAARMAAKKQKDEATIKLLGGAVLYPLAWLGAGLFGWWKVAELHARYGQIPDQPVLAGFTVAALGIVGGMVSLRYLRLVRETARAVRVRLTRARRRVSLARLRVERAELADAFELLKEGLDLPGSVTARGEVIASEVVPPGGRP